MKKLNELYPEVSSDVLVKSIQYNVSNVKRGDLFLCLATSNVDRYSQVDDAIKRGAVAVVVQDDVGYRNVPVIKVENVRRELPFLCKRYFNDPCNKIKMIGVTGTDGKSSVSLLIQSLLGTSECGYFGNDFKKCYMFKEKTFVYNSKNFYSAIDEFVKFDCNYAVVEADSLSLVNSVLEAVEFDVGIYTNISSEHLDIHGSFDNYLRSKMRLFQKVKSDGIKVLNKDDIYYESFAKVCRDGFVTYGRDNDCTLQIVEYKCMYNKTSIKFKYKDREFSIFSPLLGDFNVSNLAGSLLVCLEMGIDLDLLLSRIPKISIDEHMLFLKTNDIYKVVVDYSYTPNSILRLINFIKSLNYNRIITVIGQEGNRGIDRREHVGEVVVKNSNYVIFTNDNPGSEDPNKIIEDITKNIKNYGNYEVILDRTSAIKKAIDRADEADIVLILGKDDDSVVAYSAIADRHIREASNI